MQHTCSAHAHYHIPRCTHLTSTHMQHTCSAHTHTHIPRCTQLTSTHMQHTCSAHTHLHIPRCTQLTSTHMQHTCSAHAAHIHIYRYTHTHIRNTNLVRVPVVETRQQDATPACVTAPVAAGQGHAEACRWAALHANHTRPLHTLHRCNKHRVAIRGAQPIGAAQRAQGHTAAGHAPPRGGGKRHAQEGPCKSRSTLLSAASDVKHAKRPTLGGSSGLPCKLWQCKPPSVTG